ncbi:MAG: cellulose synthase subunit BcsC-related outer membrane protein [Hyphomonas sp.]
MIRSAGPLRAAIAGAGAMLFAGMGAQAAPDAGREGVFSIGIPTADLAQESAEQRVPPPEPDERDIRSVWTLGAEGKWEEAAGRLRALRGRHQLWRVPDSLAAYVSAGQRDQQVRDALAEEDWARVLSLLPPPETDVCERFDHIWARADALQGAVQMMDLQDFYVRTLTNCRDPGLLAALAARAASVLDDEGIAAVIRISELSGSNDPEVVQAYAALVQADAWRRFEAAKSAGDTEAAGALAENSGDANLMTQAGWMFLEPDAARGAVYFRKALAHGADDEARRGLTMAALALDDHAGARAVIADARDTSSFAGLSALADLGEARALRQQGDGLRVAELADRAVKLDPALAGQAQAISGGALLDAAGSAYDQGDFDAARTLARKAATYPPVQRAAEMRAAWAELQSGDAELAAATFSALYLATPDSESAEGFALAAQKAGTLASAAAIARAVGGPLSEKVQMQYASVAFYDGDYLTARALAPEAYEALEGVNHTIYRQTLTLRQQDGARGDNKMTGFSSTTSIEAVRGVSRYEAGVALYKLDTGAAGGAGRETFAAPYLSWSQEGETSLAARIGLMPVGGGTDPAITGEAAAIHSFRQNTAEARVFVRPRTDSLLAFAGEPGAGTGRISESGALVRGRFDVGGGRAVQAELSASSLDGRGTVSNSAISAGLSASQAIAKDGFDYLVTGPFYQFQSYNRNTNFFSAGHSGYFSPQQFHRTGWSLNARTESLKDWIVKADAAVAIESVREDASVQFPLLPDQGAVIGGGHSSGIAGALDIALARRLGREVIISANLSATASKAFEDLRAGIGLVWVPGGRAALVPSDLATDPFSPGSWIRP